MTAAKLSSTVICAGTLRSGFAIGLSAFFSSVGPLVMGVAVAGTGIASDLGGVSWDVVRAIMLAWVMALPLWAAVAVVTYWLPDLI